MSPARILVVDDEPHTRTFICDGLSALGITDDAVGVATADEAMAAVARQQPDLIITDVRMPGLNGLDLARYIRQTHPDVKVVVVTGYNTRDIEKTALALSVTALLKKPFGLDTLADVVRRALNNVPVTRTTAEMTPVTVEPLNRQINILKRDAGALWVGLLDSDGQIVTHTGADDSLEKTLNQIRYQSWSSMVAQLAERGGPCFLFVEGQPHDIYMCSVTGGHSLVLMYDRRWQTSRVGAVWLTTKLAVQEIERLLATPAAAAA